MRIITHIDMNSYFASVEQQSRPHLRGKPIAVTGPSKRSIIIAASVEAKKFGIKTGTLIPDALKLYPKIILVRSDCVKYEAISRQLFEIFISHTPQTEIFSIDEAFLDLSDRARNFEEAKSIVEEIKQEIHQRLGSNIRCSAGIGSNKFIAKLASEAKKPDGLTIIAPGEEIDFLDRFKLDDACGIGRRTKDHLARLGINSFKDLRAADQTTLTLSFNSYGLKLYNIARGIDFDAVRPYYNQNQIKSISRSKTLKSNVFDRDEIAKIILFFCQDIAANLKEKGLLSGAVGLYLRYGDFSGQAQHKVFKRPTDTGADLHFHLKQILKKMTTSKPIRKIGVWSSNLTPNNGQLYLSEEFSKIRKLEVVSEQINKKFGRRITCPASITNLNLTPSPSYGFKKDIFS